MDKVKRHDTESYKETKIRKVAFYIAITLLSLIILGVIFVSGYLQYGYSFIRCGREPIAVNYHLAEPIIEYSKPGDASYPGPSISIKYVCTEKEAVDLGARPIQDLR